MGTGSQTDDATEERPYLQEGRTLRNELPISELGRTVRVPSDRRNVPAPNDAITFADMLNTSEVPFEITLKTISVRSVVPDTFESGPLAYVVSTWFRVLSAPVSTAAYLPPPSGTSAIELGNFEAEKPPTFQ